MDCKWTYFEYKTIDVKRYANLLERSAKELKKYDHIF